MATRRAGDPRIHPGWWTLILVAVIVGITMLTTVFFLGAWKSSVPITLTSDRAGLVMETGAKVKMRGVQVGTVAQISGGTEPVQLTLQIDPDQIRYIPANVRARIRATTAFGAKYVDLTMPDRSQPATAVRRRADRVGQRQHRGQHRVPEPHRRAASDRSGQTQRDALGAGRGTARAGPRDRRGDHRRQPVC